MNILSTAVKRKFICIRKQYDVISSIISSNRIKPAFLSSLQRVSPSSPFDRIVKMSLGSEGLECDSNSLSLACILTFLCNFLVYTHSVLPVCSRDLWSLPLQSAPVIVTQRKPFMVPSFLQALCTAQLAGCKACLSNAAGPGTFQRRGAVHTKFHDIFEPFIINMAPSTTVSCFKHIFTSPSVLWESFCAQLTFRSSLFTKCTVRG